MKESWYILLRCGMGFRRLQYPFMNLELSEKYLRKANELNPNNGFVCHQLSIVCSKRKNRTDAFVFAKKASDLGVVLAVGDEIRLGLMISKKHDVINSLERNFENFKDAQKIFLLLQKGSYYMLGRGELETGLKAYLQAFNIPVTHFTPYIEVRFHFGFVFPGTDC